VFYHDSTLARRSTGGAGAHARIVKKAAVIAESNYKPSSSVAPFTSGPTREVYLEQIEFNATVFATTSSVTQATTVPVDNPQVMDKLNMAILDMAGLTTAGGREV
jgi:hypothetical protein